MEVVEVLNSGLKRQYSFTVSSDVINQKIESELENTRQDFHQPGYRKGKVPLTVIRKKIGSAIEREVLAKVIDDTRLHFFQEKKIRPVQEPKIDVNPFNKENGLKFSLTFEIFPEISFPEFSQITLTDHQAIVAEEEVEEMLNKFYSANRPKTSIAGDPTVAQGLVVDIDFQGKMNGEIFEGGTASHYQVEIGSKSLIDTFEEQLIGAKKGEERTVKVTFPENYSAKDLAGKPAEFLVKINDILEYSQEAPQDEFAKNFGFESLDALKGIIREKIENDYKTVSRNKLKKELFDALDKITDFPLPEELLDEELGTLKKQLESSEEKLTEEEVQVLAKRRVKLGMILSEYARINQIILKQEEIRQLIFDKARQFPGQEHQVIEFYRSNPNMVDMLKGPLLEEKVVDALLEKVTLTTEKVPSKDFAGLVEA